MAPHWLERADWAGHTAELGVLRCFKDRHGESMVVIEMRRAEGVEMLVYERLWELWLDLPLDSHILEAVGLYQGMLQVRYAALDWSCRPLELDDAEAIRRVATWGVELTRVCEHLSVSVPEDELGWFACPFAKLDLEGELRIGFGSPGESTAHLNRLPPEVVSRWPRCTERGLVFVVGQLLLSLVEVGGNISKSPIGAILRRCLSTDPALRYATLEALREAFVAAGGRRNAVPRATPPEVWGRVEAGIGYLLSGRATRALERFEDALERDPNSRLAIAGAQVARDRGGGLSWSMISRLSVPRQPTRHLDWLDVVPEAARLEAERGFAQALRLYWRVRPETADVATLFTAIARCHLHLGDAGHAIDYAQRALHRDRQCAEALAICTNGFLLKKQHRQALSCADRWIATYPDAGAAHYARGKSLIGLGRLFEARACFERASALEPRLLEALLLRQEVDRSLHGVRSSVGNQTTVLDVPAHLAKLASVIASGRNGDALAILQTAEYEQDPAAQVLLAGCLLFEQRPAEALAVYERIGARHDEHHHAAVVGRARALLELGRAEQALVLFDRAIAEQPADVFVIEDRARALAALGRTAEADVELRRFISVAGERSELRARLAQRSVANRDGSEPVGR